MILTWWEVEELLLHLESREHFWTLDEGSNTWLRTDNECNPLLGLQILGPNSSGPYRKFLLQIIPLSWSEEQSKDYILKLCSAWTSYGRRMAIEALLVTEVKMDEATASAVAIAINKVEQEPAPDPDLIPVPLQPSLFPDMQGCHTVPTYMERTTRHIQFPGGGYLSIRYQGEMFRIRLSIQSRDSNGYHTPFEGFIRPRDGNMPMACASLFGLEVKARVPEGDPILPGPGPIPV